MQSQKTSAVAGNSSSRFALIIGLGASGLASAEHLARRGWRIRAADTRETPA